MANPNPRVFPIQNASTTAQPILSTFLANPIAPCAINTAFGGKAGQEIAVDDPSIFEIGDYVNFIPVAGATTPAPEFQVRITDIPDASHIVALNSAPHNAGDWVQLWWPCAYVRFQELKAQPPSASLFIGNDGTVDATGNFAFEDLSIDFTFITPVRPNSDNSSNYWVISATGSPQYIVSLWQA